MDNETTPHVTPNPTQYVLGFAFEMTGEEPSVCLMRKNRPEWQAGLLNGVGGKIQGGESPHDAMAREFFEETGVTIPYGDWLEFFVMRFLNGATVFCFAAQIPGGVLPRTMEDEQVALHECDGQGRWIGQTRSIRNLSWLIPMAYHQLTEPAQERMTSSA